MLNNIFKDKIYKMIFLFFILSILSLLIIINYLEDSDGYLAILGSLITIVIYNIIFIIPVIEPKEKIKKKYKENNFNKDNKAKQYIKSNKYYKYIYDTLLKYAYLFYILLGLSWTIIDLVIHKNNISNMKIVRLIMWNFVCILYAILDIVKKFNKKG